MPAPSGQIPPPWAWWENEAPTARAACSSAQDAALEPYETSMRRSLPPADRPPSREGGGNLRRKEAAILRRKEAAILRRQVSLRFEEVHKSLPREEDNQPHPCLAWWCSRRCLLTGSAGTAKGERAARAWPSITRGVKVPCGRGRGAASATAQGGLQQCCVGFLGRA
jgi:hypothetical protein